MASPNLLPCPFCGGDQPELRNADDEIMREVVCSECDFAIMESANPQGAIARWNTRAAETEPTVEPRGCPTPGACSCIAARSATRDFVEWIDREYENPNISHRDFRIEAKRRATAALSNTGASLGETR